MEIRHLQTVRAVLEQGSFLGAARALGCSQSTVTLHVQELERELGLSLFERGGRRTRVTEAGRALGERAAEVLRGWEALHRAMAELQSGRAGELRLGAIEPAASRRMMPVLADFCRDRPRLRVTLEVGGTVGLSRQVRAGELDAALCSPPPADLGLAFDALYKERMALLVPEGHRLAKGEVKAQDLTRYPLLLTERGCRFRQAVETKLLRQGVVVRWAMEVGSMQALASAVSQGLGLALLPVEWPAPPEGTVLRELVDVELSLTVGLVQRRGEKPATQALASFLEALRADPRMQEVR